MTTDYSGGGDAERSLSLLWRATTAPTRGPKPALTVDRVVAAAIELADADGLDALSMRKVAERLGVGAMTLYTYVPGKGDLVDLMLDAVTAERRRDLGGGTWRDKLEVIARDVWDAFHRHPWLAQVSMGRPGLGPNVLAVYEAELSAVDGIGLTPDEMVSVISLLGGFAQGAARVAVEELSIERRTGVTRLEWWRKREPVLNRLVDFSAYPTVLKTGDAQTNADGPKEIFEFGLQRVLDGIEALVASRS